MPDVLLYVGELAPADVRLVDPTVYRGLAFTSKATGNWSASGQTTWNEVGVPGNGDTVTIQTGHAVTVDVNTTVGKSPATGAATPAILVTGTGSLTIAAGITLTCRGDLLLNNAVLTLAATAILEFDASQATTPASQHYVLQIGTAHNQESKLVCNGSAGSRCAIRSNSGGGNASINDGDSIGGPYLTGGQVDASYTDFTRIGTSSTPSLRYSITGTSHIFRLQHCVLDTCGRIGQTFNPDASSILHLNGVTMKNSLDADFSAVIGSSNAMSGTRTIDGCVFDKEVDLFPGRGLTIQHSIFRGLVNATNDAGGGWTLTDCLFYRSSSAGGDPAWYDGGTDCYSMLDFSNTGPHGFGITPTSRDATVDGFIFETTDPGAYGDSILTGSPAVAHALAVTRCIVLPNGAGSGGNTTGSLVTALGNANVTLTLNHNTMRIGLAAASDPERGGLRVGETYNAHAGMVASCQSNLVWDTSARGWVISNMNGAPVTDVVSAATCDYNGKFNVTGTGYSGLAVSSGTLGVHDVSGDPGFVDSSRNMAKWDLSLGGPGTVAHAIAELAKLNDAAGYNSAYTVAALLTYVRAGFAPTNAAFRGTAHDAGDIGAVAAVGGTGFTQGVADTVAFTEQLARQTNRAMAEALSLSEKLTPQTRKAILETVALTEAVVRQVLRPQAETVALTENLAAVKLAVVAIPETLALSEQLARAVAKRSDLAEALGLAEQVARRTGKSLADAVSLVENLQAIKLVVVPLAESVTLTENLGRLVLKAGGMAEALGLAEAEARRTNRTVAETLGLTENLGSVRAKFSSLADAVALSETVTRLMARVLEETVSLTESEQRQARKTLAETVAFAESLIGAVVKTKALGETVALSEAEQRRVGRGLQESLGLTESRLVAIARTVSEQIVLAEVLDALLVPFAPPPTFQIFAISSERFRGPTFATETFRGPTFAAETFAGSA